MQVPEFATEREPLRLRLGIGADGEHTQRRIGFLGHLAGREAPAIAAQNVLRYITLDEMCTTVGQVHQTAELRSVLAGAQRCDERRVGQELVSPGKSRRS